MNRTNQITSSAPLNRFTGIDDQSGTVVPARDPQFPIHCPLVPLNTKKGTTDTVYLTAAEKYLMYGVDSFDSKTKYYDENTKLSNVLAAAGNIHATMRVKPSDAPAPANVTLYMDIVKDEINNYDRNSDGSIVTDANLGISVITADGSQLVTADGEIVLVSSKVTGYRVKYFTKTFPEGVTPGAQTILNGTMVSSLPGNEVSKLYPIMDIPAKYFGAAYSNIGFKISPVTGTSLKDKFKTTLKALPYEITIYERADADSSGVAKKTLTGGTNTLVTFMKNSTHPYTESTLDVDLQFPHSWYNEDTSKSEIRYYDLDNVHMYYSNLETVLGKIVATEESHVNATKIVWSDNALAATYDWYDFTNDSGLSTQKHLLNWVTLKSSSKGVPYFSVMKDNTTVTAPTGMQEVTLGSDSIIYLRSGGDGTISKAMTEKFIKMKMLDYLDGDSEVMSLVTNKESGIYDIGYSIDTKKALANMIAVRPDTIVKWCTHDSSYGETAMSTDEEYRMAVALLARAAIFPESEVFATSTARATVTLGSMEDIDSVSKYRYTQNFELANIFSQYLGASNGKAKPLKCLDEGRANTILTLGKNYTPKFIPDSFKETLWTTGITYAEPYKINQRAFLAVRTIFGNETSILTSPMTLYANAVMCRAMDDAHKEFAGNEKDTRAVFANKVIKFLDKKVADVFDNGRFDLSFEVVFTDDDIARGYSYSIIGKISGNVMKTAQVTTVATYRKE